MSTPHYEEPHLLPCIDAAHIERQITWSEATFGPGVRKGVVDHIRKELKEIEDADYTDLEEWIDVIILGIDGAWRAGYSAHEIISMLRNKQVKNENRTWPDWRTVSTDFAIEHMRD